MKTEDPIEAELKRITAEQKKLAAAIEGVLHDLAKRRAIFGSSLAATEAQAIELTLNAAERSVTIGGAKAYLQPAEFQTLSIICSEPSPISRGTILSKLRPEEPRPAESIITVYISNIRKKIRSINSGTDIFQTIHGRGIKLRDGIVGRQLDSGVRQAGEDWQLTS